VLPAHALSLTFWTCDPSRRSDYDNFRAPDRVEAFLLSQRSICPLEVRYFSAFRSAQRGRTTRKPNGQYWRGELPDGRPPAFSCRCALEHEKDG
jgi:hypothetical protein